MVLILLPNSTCKRGMEAHGLPSLPRTMPFGRPFLGSAFGLSDSAGMFRFGFCTLAKNLSMPEDTARFSANRPYVVVYVYADVVAAAG